ncbi:TonB-dependent receptor [Sphingomonas alba]|uniref:TonB-dependent receptor n=1 Tax=Sphingomonas alba TaxID=2908208 RepID=A0ABT0RJV4_9SPHN|nr:TonB-dependent receptor [Sphingomonas alba]MCL6682911.1 TonB-dependent receptor [Sphingomonas alba]
MRLQSHNTPKWKRAATALLATTFISAPLYAQTAPADPAEKPAAAAAQESEDIIVTAQKRTENLQDVPIAITAITTKTLDDLQVDSFEDYARLVPSLSSKAGGGGGSADGPGTNNVYFRGVASGDNANHSASLPSVGTYLDEQPITTISGALDIHIFDIARVEALAGPQGTLYGASSQAGTVRIITNKPDLSSTYGAANLELNKVAHGDWGYTGEGFINLPISSNVATRIVGWYRHDGGYIDNIHGSRTMREVDSSGTPTGGSFTFDNGALAEDNYNDVDTYGARAALKIDLNDNWTITPQVIGQVQKADGSFAEERGLGKLETMQFNPESLKDKWIQAALTVEGKLGNFDVTYAGSYMRRQVDSELDYSDYSYFYDELTTYGAYWYDNDYNPLLPNQLIQADDSYKKMSHELRVASPSDKRLRLIGGLFYQRQEHNIEQNYIVPGLADVAKVPGTNDIWYTKQLRVDRDYAAFGELSFDITPQLTATAGGRWYKYDNSLVGFFGFASYVGDCFGPSEISGTPCTNLDKRVKDTGFVHRLNLTYKPNEDMLFYATWSRGFRPGGVNRRGTFPPYDPDYLTNYEAGAKISFGHGSHFNVAGYIEDWKDMQVSLLGQNGLTVVRNVGKSRITGIEADLLLRPMPGLTWSTGVSYNHAVLREDFCFQEGVVDCRNAGLQGGLDFLAEKGDKLPLTAPWKGSSALRYEWNLNADLKANVQGVLTYEGKRKRDLRPGINDIYGDLNSYAEVDISAGLDKGPWSVDLFAKNLFDVRGQLSKGIQCREEICGDPFGETASGGKIYTVVSRPRTIGLRVGRKF